MNLSPEDKLLLSCVRTKLDAKTLRKMQGLIAVDLDWDGVVERASRHRIVPLLYHNLGKMGENNAIPQSVMEKLRRVSHANVARNMRLYSKLGKVLESLKLAGIEVIVLKGAALAETVYQNIALRPMADIDLLIERKDLERTEKCLSELGYSRHREKREDYESYYRTYFDRRKTIPVHGHWGLTRAPNAFELDIDAMFERAERCELAGIETLVLSPEDTILHLSLHLFFTHFFNVGLIGMIDIARIIERFEMDWENVVMHSKKCKIASGLYFVLYFVKELFDTPIPGETLKKLEPSPFKKKIVLRIATDGKSILRSVFRDANTARAQATVLHLWLAENLRDSLETALRLLFPPREFMPDTSLMPAPSTNICFRYFIRQTQLLSRYGRTTLRLLLAASHEGNRGNEFVRNVAEESGSPDLGAHIGASLPEIGQG